MTVSLKHAFQSAKTDSADLTIVQPSNWNEEHELTAAAGVVLGRDTSSAGVVQELPIAVTPAGNVGIGTTTPGQKLTVAGTIESTTGGVKFPDGSTQTTAAGSVSYPQNVQSGNYTLVLSDAGKHIYSANSGAQTITVPTNAAVAFPIGTLITIVNFGTTNILIGATGISIYLNGSTTAVPYPLIAPGVSFQLLKTSTNGWQSMFGAVSQFTFTHLSVAGGGGGGAPAGGGGGGAGGFVTGTVSHTSGNTLTVSVGAGGAAGVIGTTAVAGTNSSITNAVAAVGGGKGGDSPGGGTGGSGGSGGGGFGGNSPVYVGGAGTAGQGNGGGSGSTSQASGGGGGAGAVGDTTVGLAGGNGGAGLASSISGTAITYAGGGGGGTIFSNTPATGGTGGGGTGANGSTNATAGTTNLGGGGGGGGGSSPVRAAGAGGSGRVVISTLYPATATTGSPVVTTSGANTIYTFNSSGTITF
jgi:hypothetical protein